MTAPIHDAAADGAAHPLAPGAPPQLPDAPPVADAPQRQQRPLRRAWRHSLKARLVTMFLLLALGTTALFLWGARGSFSAGWRDLARPLVADCVDRLAAEIGSPPDIGRAQALTRRLPLSVRIDGPVVNGSSHSALRPDRGPQRPSHDVGRDISNDISNDISHNISHNISHDAGRDVTNTLSHNAPGQRWDRLLSRSTADGHHIRFGVGRLALGRSAGLAGLAGAGWCWLVLAGLQALTALAYGYVRRLFRPIDDIRAGARRYGGGDLSLRIPVRRRDELGELATQVNTMASSLRHMLERQRGLLLAISHELRSPLTRARLHTELMAEGPEQAALLRDLGQMRDLISDLLEGERLAEGSAALQRENTDLNALVTAVVDAQFAGRAITLALDPAMPILALDRTRLQLLVRNLLANALRHGAAMPVTLDTRLVDGAVYLRVRDPGPGVAPAQLPHLTEASYRPDGARTRSAGGVGLGLYPCRLVAQSHGGRLDLCHAAPGLEVSLWLPFLPASATRTAASPG